MRTTTEPTGQLTWEIKEGPDTRARREAGMHVHLEGSLTLKGAFACPRDLNDGDTVIVTIAGPDGEILDRREAHLTKPPAMVPIKLEGATIGYTRAHTADV